MTSFLVPGNRLKEVATRERVFHDCRVLSADAIGLTFEVQRTVTEGGDVETVTTQVLVPWANLTYGLIGEKTL